MRVVERADQIALGEYGRHLNQLNREDAARVVWMALYEKEVDEHVKKYRL
jgi:hypothetical protein